MVPPSEPGVAVAVLSESTPISESSSASSMEPWPSPAPPPPTLAWLGGRNGPPWGVPGVPSKSSAWLHSSEESSTATREGLLPEGHTCTSDISMSVSSSVVAMGAHSRLETSCQKGSAPSGEGRLYCMEAGERSSSCTSP